MVGGGEEVEERDVQVGADREMREEHVGGDIHKDFVPERREQFDCVGVRDGIINQMYFITFKYLKLNSCFINLN